MTDKKQILIVEDNADTLRLLEQVVRSGGYEPLLAQGIKAGWRLLAERGADLVLLDLILKDGSGWTLLKQIKADARLETTPVIVVSAKKPAEQLPESKTLAGLYDGYLVKPFALDGLLAAIARALDPERLARRGPLPEQDETPQSDEGRTAITTEDRSVEELFDMAISAEEAAREIYRCLADRFAQPLQVAEFWRSMMRDVEQHARQLAELRDSLPPGRRAALVPPSLVGQAQRNLEMAAQVSLDSIATLADAYRLAQQLEGSEVNKIYGLLMSRYLDRSDRDELIISQIRDHTARLFWLAQFLESEGEGQAGP